MRSIGKQPYLLTVLHACNPNLLDIPEHVCEKGDAIMPMLCVKDMFRHRMRKERKLDAALVDD